MQVARFNSRIPPGPLIMLHISVMEVSHIFNNNHKAQDLSRDGAARRPSNEPQKYDVQQYWRQATNVHLHSKYKEWFVYNTMSNS